MKIVVVGGTGLIGSKVVSRLRAESRHGAPLEVVVASRATGVDAYTGERLAESLAGASVVVDVSNPGYLDDDRALDYFETATLKLLVAGAAAGVRHHVGLSVVGTDRLAAGGGGYFRAKQTQERLIRASGRPFSIVHSTQFYEFVPQIAEAAADGDGYAVSQALVQPVAGDDTAAAVVAAALGEPSGGTTEIAGPQSGFLAEFVKLWVVSSAPERPVESDPLQRYFGSRLLERDLLPGPAATLATRTYADWLEQNEGVLASPVV